MLPRSAADGVARALAFVLAVAVCATPIAGQAPARATGPAASGNLEVLRISRPAPDDSSSTDLDSLVARALVVSPAVQVARARLAAARARVAPAGARPDPTLMAGVQDLPVSQPGFSDFMTMKMVGVSQTIPYPGKLRLQTAAATRESDAVSASLVAVRLDVAREVRDAYYDLAYADAALEITNENERALTGLVRVTHARYAVGTGAQADVLRAQLETTRLAGEANALAEGRRAALARLNALLDQPSETPIHRAHFPAALVRLATPDLQVGVHFTTASLGSRIADSPLLPLDSLQALAVRSNPALRAHEAMIAAQRARVALARRASRPDVDVSLQYGQRAGFADMVTAVVSVPLPLQHARKQDGEIASTSADLDALEGEHHEQVNALRAELAARYADAERARTQIALTTSAVLPQARATLASATASFEVGRVGFDSVIDAQALVFNAEVAYDRALADFGKALAALEQGAGTEVLQ